MTFTIEYLNVDTPNYDHPAYIHFTVQKLKIYFAIFYITICSNLSIKHERVLDV